MALQTAFIYKPASWAHSYQEAYSAKQEDGLSKCTITEQPYNVDEERYHLSGLIMSLGNTRKIHRFFASSVEAQEALEAERLAVIKSFMAGFSLNPL
jgi:hypothetical protein